MEASLQTILFWLFAILGIAGGIGLIFNRNPIYAALSLVINFFSIAGLYLTLNAEFLAVIQILVYTGAIMVLFLFVIMLFNLTDEEKLKRFDSKRGLAFVIGAGFVGEMFYVLKGFSSVKTTGTFDYGTTESIGRAMMTDYLFPFEMISIILLSALIGAVVVAKKYRYDEIVKK